MLPIVWEELSSSAKNTLIYHVLLLRIFCIPSDIDMVTVGGKYSLQESHINTMAKLHPFA